MIHWKTSPGMCDGQTHLRVYNDTTPLLSFVVPDEDPTWAHCYAFEWGQAYLAIQKQIADNHITPNPLTGTLFELQPEGDDDKLIIEEEDGYYSITVRCPFDSGCFSLDTDEMRLVRDWINANLKEEPDGRR